MIVCNKPGYGLQGRRFEGAEPDALYSSASGKRAMRVSVALGKTNLHYAPKKEQTNLDIHSRKIINKIAVVSSKQ